MILTAKNFRQLLTTRGRYRDTLGEVRGLMLVVVNERNASWQLRYERVGRERWMGLGSARLISLREARIRARAARLQLLDGNDPLLAKQQAKAATMTFAAAAEAYHAQHRDKWKSGRHVDQFLSSLGEYVFPIFGAQPVGAIDTGMVLKVLEQAVPAAKGKPAGSLWATRQETASRIRRRIENVLDWASVRGYRAGDNPARWAGHLAGVLPATAPAKAKHWAALPYGDAATFLAELRVHTGVAARALEFTILTAARTGEVIGARWDEIDLLAGTWSIPAARMKAGKAHRVPLAGAALDLLRALPKETNNPFVFIGSRSGASLSSLVMAKLLARMSHKGVTVHGFRSTFMDWAHETTAYPKVVIDMALAHVVGDKVEAAYRRGDLYAKRRTLMDAWAIYCSSPISAANVLPLRR